MSAVPSTLPVAFQNGVMCAIAAGGRLISPEMIIAMSCNTPPTHMAMGFMMIKGQPVEVARNMLADLAIKHNCKYLWFVDDDTIPPPNAVKRLIYVLENNPDIMVAGGIYPLKTDPPAPCVFRGANLGSFWRWKVGQVFEVSAMGAGCMMINCEVFKHIKPPFFSWTTEDSTDPHVGSTMISEDVNFCAKVRQAGFRVAAHGGILCDHFDHASGRSFQIPEDSYPYKPEYFPEAACESIAEPQNSTTKKDE